MRAKKEQNTLYINDKDDWVRFRAKAMGEDEAQEGWIVKIKSEIIIQWQNRNEQKNVTQPREED